MSFCAVVVAAGSGLRAGPGEPKAWRQLGGRPILRWSVEAMLAAGARTVAVVVAPDRLDSLPNALSNLPNWLGAPGGETRARSVQAGLSALGDVDPATPVLIHDAARPFLQTRTIRALVAALDDADGAIPALPVADTLKRGENQVAATVDRADLFRAQTPQTFRLGALRAAYGAWPATEEPTDDASVMERTGARIVFTPGDPMLMKLTYQEDFAMAEHLAGSRRTIRTGLGVDAHRFGPGSAVWLCGVEIPHDRGLVGHSDADCALHALTDAILGAIGDGDIGQHFPPSDPKWKDASSDQFLRHAAERVAARGGRIISVDVTLICERPKIGPHREAMRARVGEILSLSVDRVSVKATTTEGMGFTGRQEGLAAQAVANVEVAA